MRYNGLLMRYQQCRELEEGGADDHSFVVWGSMAVGWIALALACGLLVVALLFVVDMETKKM